MKTTEVQKFADTLLKAADQIEELSKAALPPALSAKVTEIGQKLEELMKELTGIDPFSNLPRVVQIADVKKVMTDDPFQNPPRIA